MKYLVPICLLTALCGIQRVQPGKLTDDRPKTTLCLPIMEETRICEGENVQCCPILINGMHYGNFTCLKDEWNKCEDCLHYCEKGFSCSMENGNCIANEGKAVKPWTPMVNEGPSRHVRSVKPTERQVAQAEHEDSRVKRDLTKALDSRFCNNGTGTLCREDFGGNCCPGEHSVCCVDKISCCPKDSTCDVNLHICYFY